MLRTLTFETGAQTCASEPGKFCRWAAATHFGTLPVCTLFLTERGDPRALKDKDGWLQRLAECKNEFGV